MGRPLQGDTLINLALRFTPRQEIQLKFKMKILYCLSLLLLTGPAPAQNYPIQPIPFHQVQLEDIFLCESVQHALHSRTYDKGRLSVKRENGVHHFHKLVAESLGEN